MFNIIFEEEYAVAPQLIAQMRRQAGLSQRDMAAALNRSQGHIHRMETRQRPIELVEFCRMARICGVEPSEALDRLLVAWAHHSCATGPMWNPPRDTQRTLEKSVA